jgi:hypothetical protein
MSFIGLRIRKRSAWVYTSTALLLVTEIPSIGDRLGVDVTGHNEITLISICFSVKSHRLPGREAEA